jgi:hypothetical protein
VARAVHAGLPGRAILRADALHAFADDARGRRLGAVRVREAPEARARGPAQLPGLRSAVGVGHALDARRDSRIAHRRVALALRVGRAPGTAGEVARAADGLRGPAVRIVETLDTLAGGDEAAGRAVRAVADDRALYALLGRGVADRRGRGAGVRRVTPDAFAQPRTRVTHGRALRTVGGGRARGMACVVGGPAGGRRGGAVDVLQALRALAGAGDTEGRCRGAVRVGQTVDAPERGVAFLRSQAIVRAADPAQCAPRSGRTHASAAPTACRHDREDDQRGGSRARSSSHAINANRGLRRAHLATGLTRVMSGDMRPRHSPAAEAPVSGSVK